jgi:C-terminal processing protease CtpA/Prc
MRSSKVAPYFGIVVALALLGCAPSVGSIGAVLGQDRKNGRVTVHEVAPGLGGAKAGLRDGDEIISIDGQDVRDFSPADVAEALRGPVGSEVALTVVRDRTEIVRVKVQRTPFRRRNGENRSE